MMSFWHPVTWLRASCLVVVLILLSGSIWAQDDASQRSVAQAQEIRLQLKNLSGQLASLRQTSTQSDRHLSLQVQGVQKQIEQLEQRQAELIERLQRLQSNHEQNQNDHRLHNQQLAKVLWGLTGLGGLILLVLWRLRSPRKRSGDPFQLGAVAPLVLQTAATPPQAKQNTVEQTSSVDQATVSSEPGDSEASPLNAPIAVEALVSSPLAVPPAIVFPSPFLNAPADLAVLITDSSSTEQVLAKGLQGFMQPVQFK